ncbi:RDD family protein [Moheibacter sediminis]|uniref:Uncharacterized membrane protein YckC, RDD family n=1 Tax=Moheibacter sediminis TaxID=1434700 RepID=A0A1W2BQJ3_9FLAO|nr:RDD family protein [Moheibacter sediminis]SMC75229.1 Uncharacterized membrane protein YckC, RDD family [Moheibacter sediminis]
MTEINTKTNITDRIFAGLIDYTIIFGIGFFLIYSMGAPNNEGGYSLKGLPALIPVLFWLIFTVGIESFFGVTIGNSIMNLKPIPMNEEERKLTFGESLKRHLADPIDMFFFGLIGILTIKNSDKNQRVGDIWAKTIVIHVNSKKVK